MGLATFFTFAIILPILPLLTFYAIYYGFLDGVLGYWNVGPITESSKGLVSALTAVGVVNLIAGCFVLLAFTEKPPPTEENSKKED